MKSDEKQLKQWLAGFEQYYVDSVSSGPLYREAEETPPIWQMWWQGVDQCPDLVRICLDSVQRHAGGRPVRIVTQETLADYVEIPGHIYDKLASGAMTITHFSDIARVFLLAAHGGTWIDAAVLLVNPIPKTVTDDPFFAYRVTTSNIKVAHCLFASQFMHARPGHAIPVSLCRALTNYWQNENTLADYFLFQYMCCGVIFGSPLLTRLWMRECSQESVTPAVTLIRLMHKKYDPAVLTRALRGSFVHFLTRKYSKVPKGSNFEAFLRGETLFLGK